MTIDELIEATKLTPLQFANILAHAIKKYDLESELGITQVERVYAAVMARVPPSELTKPLRH